jgi:hypothetical protein
LRTAAACFLVLGKEDGQEHGYGIDTALIPGLARSWFGRLFKATPVIRVQYVMNAYSFTKTLFKFEGIS